MDTETKLGLKLFRLFYRMQLYGIQRTDDAYLVESMRLSRERGTTAYDLLSRIQVLSRATVRRDPALRSEAMVLSALNEARSVYTKSRLVQLAKERGTPVLAWRTPPTPGTRKLLNINLANLLYDRNEQLYQYFVPDADVLFTYNGNLDLQIANGSSGRTRSICLNPLTKAVEELRISHAAPGDVVLIEPPASVNVEVMQLEANQRFPLDFDLGTNVIPLCCERGKNVTVRLRASRDRAPPPVLTFKTYEFMYKCAMTYHKVQGQTCSRIILDPSSSRLTFAHILVGQSRVRKSEHLYLIKEMDRETIVRLKRIRAPDYLHDWNESYVPVEGRPGLERYQKKK